MPETASDALVLSHFHVVPLLDARRAGARTAETSLDLGLTWGTVVLESERALFPDGQSLSWSALETIGQDHAACYEVRESTATRIQRYSEAMGRVVSLMPTERAPTLLLSGFPMHRIKGIDPHEDTLRKIRTIAPVTGRVLDTTTGLGYTAIEAARAAGDVLTMEVDPTVLEVARRNPWSRELFTNPRIRQRVGSAFDLVSELEEGAFDRIFHDPPTFRLAGELYSGEFYRQLRRVLKKGGRLFHYVGDLESRHGAGVARGVIRRLKEAGFLRVTRRPEAFGLTAEG